MTTATPIITTFGELDQGSYDQIVRCADAGDAVAAALMADHHLGYSQPIGGVVAYKDKISPSGVGYDIACGNKAVRTNVRVDDIVGRTDGAPLGAPFGAAANEPLAGAHKNEASAHAYSDDAAQSVIARIMDEIAARISFGMGRKNNEPVDHPVLDAIRKADFAPQRGLIDMAAQQLGTVGSGNHYVDLFAGDDGWIWVGNHFGSRGFGHKTASGFLALAEGKGFGDHAAEGEMHSPPILFDTDSDLGQSYIAAMELAGQYAYAGRDVVIDKVLEILGAEATYEVHNHHNFAWREKHFGEDVWVIRKGATPAFPGQQGFVGASMGEDAVIIEGRTVNNYGATAMYSTVHGAGRVMSRTKAAGKSRKRWTCCNRDCDWFQGPGQHKPDDGNCPKCGHDKLTKTFQQISEGVIDWPAAKADLKAKGIELRGAGADEAPGAYKRLPEVLAAHADSIQIKHTLRPIGVAMAGPDIFDPYKD